MRKLFLSLLALAFVINLTAQDFNKIDSLKEVLRSQKEDTLKIETFSALCWAYIFYKPDSARHYAEECLQLAKKINSKDGEDNGYLYLWASEFVKGNYYRAIEIITERLKISEENNDMKAVAKYLGSLFNCYRDMGDYKNAFISISRSKMIFDSLGATGAAENTNLGNAYEKLGQLDSALFYANKGYEIEYVKNKGSWTWPAYELGSYSF